MNAWGGGGGGDDDDDGHTWGQCDQYKQEPIQSTDLRLISFLVVDFFASGSVWDSWFSQWNHPGFLGIFSLAIFNDGIIHCDK